MAHYLNGHDCSFVDLEPSEEITHALRCAAFTGKRVVENARQTLQFCSGVYDAYIYQITPLLPCGLCSCYRAALYSILQNENQRHLDFFSLAFRKC